VAVSCHQVVREITPGEVLNDLIGNNAVTFTEFQDRKKQENYKDFNKAFCDNAIFFKQKFHQYGATNWMAIDTRAYPELRTKF